MHHAHPSLFVDGFKQLRRRVVDCALRYEISHQDRRFLPQFPLKLVNAQGRSKAVREARERREQRSDDVQMPRFHSRLTATRGGLGRARKGSYKTDLNPHCPECSRFTAPHLIYLAVAWDVACTQVFHLSKRRFLSSDTGGTGQSQRTRVHPRCSVCIRSLQSDSKPNFYVDVRLSATDR